MERLNQGMRTKLTLISASAGFGKTTLLSEWVARCKQPVAWLSLDEVDNDPARFLTYLVSALQTIVPNIGKHVLAVLQSPQFPATESLLTSLLNEMSAEPQELMLVLDDYHAIESKPVDNILAFMLGHLPANMHLVIATREDPAFPLTRLRAQAQLTELRAADLRFSPSEAAEFLNRVMGLELSGEDIAALETRTEGWIAGLQLAALSMQGHEDIGGFIQAFTGSHRFVLDYLVEEVLNQQSESIQNFLLRTSILERMCGPLCDAVMGSQFTGGQQFLEKIERANLFINTLDNERRWYRYHHLFAELLHQRLEQSISKEEKARLHIQASEWLEHNGHMNEAFRHAVAANDIQRAEQLIDSRKMSLHQRIIAMPVLDWLSSLPKAVLDARPGLWVHAATLSLMVGQVSQVEKNLRSAEAALAHFEPSAETRDLIGRMACARATRAVMQLDPETMLTQAQHALQNLHPENWTFLFIAHWALANAQRVKGDRHAAALASRECMALTQKPISVFSRIMAFMTRALLQELDNQLFQAVESYQQALQLSSDHPQPNITEAHFGLARIYYEWNNLELAEQHAQSSAQLSRLFDRGIDRFIVNEMFLARVKISRGDISGAAALISSIEKSVSDHDFTHCLPEVAAGKIALLIQQQKLAEALPLAQKYELLLNQARVLILQGDSSAALKILDPYCQQMQARDWKDQLLKGITLQALALYSQGEKEKAISGLKEALTMAKAGGFMRLFLDEGAPMASLLTEACLQGIKSDYLNQILSAFKIGRQAGQKQPSLAPDQPWIEPLSQRELEVLRLIAQGLSNREIAERLFLALSTVKGHSRVIFDKLQVQRRTEAVARAREIGLL